MRIAVLDDYLHLSQKAADWSKLPPGCEVTVFDRPLRAPDEAADAIASEFGATRVDKEVLFRRSDVLSVHMVLADATRNIVAARDLALMKPTAILINTSRGPLIEEQALIAALRERRIADAGLDVYHREPLPDDDLLRTLPNVVLTPHLGYATEEFFKVAYEDPVENIAAFASGKPIRVLTAERNDSRLVRI